MILYLISHFLIVKADGEDDRELKQTSASAKASEAFAASVSFVEACRRLCKVLPCARACSNSCCVLAASNFAVVAATFALSASALTWLAKTFL